MMNPLFDTNLQLDLWREEREQRKFLEDFGGDLIEVKENVRQTKDTQ